MEEKIAQIQKEYLEKISQSTSLKELDGLFLDIFGKNGAVTLLPKDFSKLPEDARKKVGPLFNTLKQELEKAIELKRVDVREESYKKLEGESLDLNEKTDVKSRIGLIHPLDQFEHEIVELFSKIGFQQYDAPQIDTDDFNI